MFDPVIQRYMTSFYDVQGNLHITIKPDLTAALGWAKSKYNDKTDMPELVSELPVALQINYGKKEGVIDKSCEIVLKPKALMVDTLDK